MTREDEAPASNDEDKPLLLKAVALVLADPAEIKREVEALLERYQERLSSELSDEEVRDRVAAHIVSNYSYYTAYVGGATALTGVIPGLGTVVATAGGPMADAALSMKFQIEMVMAIAVAYDHDIMLEEQKHLCLLVAGLGTINKAAADGGKQLSSKAFIKMTQQYLKGASLQAVKELFKKIGITFTRKAAEKAIPFGIGVIIGFSANKALTHYVGTKARDFFRLTQGPPRSDRG